MPSEQDGFSIVEGGTHEIISQPASPSTGFFIITSLEVPIKIVLGIMPRSDSIHWQQVSCSGEGSMPKQPCKHKFPCLSQEIYQVSESQAFPSNLGLKLFSRRCWSPACKAVAGFGGDFSHSSSLVNRPAYSPGILASSRKVGSTGRRATLQVRLNVRGGQK